MKCEVNSVEKVITGNDQFNRPSFWGFFLKGLPHARIASLSLPYSVRLFVWCIAMRLWKSFVVRISLQWSSWWAFPNMVHQNPPQLPDFSIRSVRRKPSAFPLSPLKFIATVSLLLQQCYISFTLSTLSTMSWKDLPVRGEPFQPESIQDDSAEVTCCVNKICAKKNSFMLRA